MFGIEIVEVVSLTRQLGLAVSGAAALWSLVFILKARRSSSKVSGVVFHWIAHRLTYLIYGGAAVSFTSWLAHRFYMTPVAHAHEGISIAPSLSEAFSAFAVTTPVFVFWIIAILATLVLQLRNQRVFHNFAPVLFASHLLIVIFLISFSTAWTGDLSNEKIFFILHNFHSILTIGTVLVLDYLFLSIKSSVVLQRNVFPLFPMISKVIWIGLGLDFLSVAFIFPEAVSFDARFFFAQTVVGILIINGVILAGPLTRRILATLRHGVSSMPKKWKLVADVCGTVSVTSWTFITVVDFFHSLTLSYAQLMAVYGVVLLILFTLHMIWEHLDRDEPVLAHEAGKTP